MLLQGSRLTFARSYLRQNFPEHWRIQYSDSLRPHFLYDMSGHVWCEGHGFPVGKTRIGVDVMYAKQTLCHIKNIIFTVFIHCSHCTLFHENCNEWHCTSPQLDGFSPRWNINGFLLRECYGNRTFASVLDEIYRESRGTLTAMCPISGARRMVW